MKNNKTVLKKRVSQLLTFYPIGIPIGESDFKLLMELLKNHENYKQKVGCGIESIIIKPHPIYKNRGFYLIRYDGSETDFLYRKCFNTQNYPAKVTSAFRVAIKDQIISFRDKTFLDQHEIVCPLTGDTITKNECHIDHKPPKTFKKLLAEFIELTKIDINKVPINGSGIDNAFGYTLNHQEIKKQWESYHKENAILRVVSRNARH